MSKLNFDDRGHLVPYDRIETDWEVFVDTFGWNDSRRFLINQLHAFTAELTNLPIIRCTLWIDGSFVTQKEQPKDLDVVVVLPTHYTPSV